MLDLLAQPHNSRPYVQMGKEFSEISVLIIALNGLKINSDYTYNEFYLGHNEIAQYRKEISCSSFTQR
jgi:hypothetical protein